MISNYNIERERDIDAQIEHLSFSKPVCSSYFNCFIGYRTNLVTYSLTEYKLNISI